MTGRTSLAFFIFVLIDLLGIDGFGQTIVNPSFEDTPDFNGWTLDGLNTNTT